MRDDMFLNGLPNELLTMIIRELPLKSRFRLRETCKKFRSLVDAVGVLPLSPLSVDIDFGMQIIVVTEKEENEKLISYAVVSGVYHKKSESHGEWKSSLLDNHPCLRTLCNVEHRWVDFVRSYMRKLKRCSNQETCSLLVIIANKVPPELLLWSRYLEKLSVFGDVSFSSFSSIPDHICEWMLNTDPIDLNTNVTLSPSQLDRVTAHYFSRLLTEEGALHILNRFTTRTLPRFHYWTFRIHRGYMSFLAHLCSHHKVLPKESPTSYQVWFCIAGTIIMDLHLDSYDSILVVLQNFGYW